MICVVGDPIKIQMVRSTVKDDGIEAIPKNVAIVGLVAAKTPFICLHNERTPACVRSDYNLHDKCKFSIFHGENVWLAIEIHIKYKFIL